jgi:hypothetical protein
MADQQMIYGSLFEDDYLIRSTIGNNETGKIFVSTFSQLVDTAEKRLFGLRQKLAFMYDDVPGMDLYKQTLTRLNFK